MRAVSLKDRLPLTYVCDTDERDEERGNYDEEREELSVFVQAFEFVDESRDHRLHPSHLKKSLPRSPGYEDRTLCLLASIHHIIKQRCTVLIQ